MLEGIDREIAGHLLRIGAVVLRPGDPFTWASGLRSPIYCDNRLTIAFPEVRSRIASGFETLLRASGIHPDVVVGTATAGIPHAAWLADRMNLPMAYVRSAAKAHGKGNQIEGRIEPGQRTVIVEDLVSTGGSSRGVVEAVRQAGASVEAVVAIFSYGLPEADATYAEIGVPLLTLSRFDVLLDVAVREGRFGSDQLDSLRAWRQDPRAWSEAH